MNIIYNIGVEEDDRLKGKYMVVISDRHNVIFGIPMRGVTKKVAEASVSSLKYAFEYGLTAQAQAPAPYIGIQEVSSNTKKTE